MGDQQGNGPQQGQQPAVAQKKPIYKRVWFWVVVVVAVIVIASVASGGGKSTGGSSGGTDSAGKAETSQKSAKSSAQQTLYDKKGIKVTVTEKSDDLFEPGYNIKMVNKSSAPILVTIDDMSVKGKMVDNWFYEDVAAGKTAEAVLYSSDVTNVDDLVDVEATLSISNGKNYSSIVDKTVKFK